MDRLKRSTCILSLIALLLLPGYSLAIDNDIDAEFLMAVKKGNLEQVNSLLNSGADVNTAQKDGTSALAWAVYNNNKELVDLLIRSGEDGADIDAANEYGFNPLHLACMNQNPEIISILLKAGANPNNSKWTGESPLMTCANTGTTDAVKTLLDQGADVNSVETTQQQTALMWAVAEKHPQVVKLLVERGANINAVSKLTPEPEPFMVKTPGSMGQNFPSTLRFREATGGFTALLFAAQQGDLESAKILLDAGADMESVRILGDYGVNTDVKTFGGATLFMLAAGAGAEKGVRDEQKAIELTKYVLSLGDIDVNVQLTDNRAKNGPGAGKIDGRNITHFAVTLGWSEMIHFLADVGVNLDHSDRYGMTPLMIAMGDPEVRYYRNIPVGRYDDRYRRPRANKEIEKVLLDAGASEFAGTIVDKGSVD